MKVLPYILLGIALMLILNVIITVFTSTTYIEPDKFWEVYWADYFNIFILITVALAIEHRNPS